VEFIEKSIFLGGGEKGKTESPKKLATAISTGKIVRPARRGKGTRTAKKEGASFYGKKTVFP